ncbi:PAS 9 domain containing protein [Sulfitobacter noctilucicola]|uniref:PAS domain S-box-containing protein n=1 Tax=Sulfitobacter noctilucicola TaxID=1342301 RepID=A0A7W6M6S2_9RHOB|nr:PAS domain-containing protein [Sulfitobacter noctilucicola]KIN62740.1 PAS 9 domain containing protein [Sulfitobacter noctilucicola]MBB4172727.1 PAS domain S-box-containing protein [Sulfitobacter noctilucicola]
MFQTLSIPKLEELLDQFSVPMFVIERTGPRESFILATLNRAFEELSGTSRHDLLGQPIIRLASTGMPEEAISYYRNCIRTGETVRFSYTYTDENGDVLWETTLQHANGPDNEDRIIATAMKLPREQSALQDQLAFDDLHYFSSMADLQLENLSSAFDSVVCRPGFTEIDEDRVMRLHAVCRTVQRSVADIKDIVRRAQIRHARQVAPPIASCTHKMDTGPQLDTARAIVATSGVRNTFR